jgi:exo-beta-1,3-glucanase (GH17 family)
MKVLKITFFLIFICSVLSCEKTKNESQMTAKDILGNPDYLAMSYGGYRNADHSIEPTIDELKEDMKIIHAMGVRVLRTYKVHLPHATNVLKAITELKIEDANFEMYVMLGAWINCKDAFTDKKPDHSQDNPSNAIEIDKAAALASQYPDIVKIIAVGNEAMVTWQAEYYVKPWIILKWVNHLQELKKTGKLSKDLWITSSDNFASWGGGEESYHTEDLNKLIKTVDFISMHSYPMHDTYWNSDFWGVPKNESELSDIEKIDAAMTRSLDYLKSQYRDVESYMKSLGVNKPIHIGETGWATKAKSLAQGGHFGSEVSKATDEYKEAKFHELVRDWTNENKISCFYFEAFDEPWKGGNDPEDSEKHFGLFTVAGNAKYALWKLVDQGVFNGLSRNGNPITKTYSGDKEALMKDVLVPPTQEEVLTYKPN